MGFSHLLSLEAILATFMAAYNVHEDVDIAYCHEGDIDIQSVVVKYRTLSFNGHP